MTDKFLELIGIRTQFGQVQALRDVSLTLARGEVVCLIGPSGCGKSTLLRTANWLTPPQQGSVRLDGAIVGTAPVRHMTAAQSRALNAKRARIGMVFQQFNTWPHMTALDNVTRAQQVVLKRAPAMAEAKARQVLADVGLSDKLAAWPDRLSGGQKQRLAIARALAMDPALMLLDEPTSALDPELVAEVLAVLKRLADQNMTMLIVTHELGFARQVADRIVFMEAGQIVEDGPPSQLLSTPRTDRLRAFLDKLSLTALPTAKEPANDPV